MKSFVATLFSMCCRFPGNIAYASSLLLATSFGHVSFAQAPAADPKLVAAIDHAVEKLGITAEGPGVAVWIYQPEKLHFQKGYGLASLKSKEAITAKTNFELASLSKMITATAVLILHDRGKLSIHDDLRKVLPKLKDFHPEQRLRVIDLLHHVSGLPDYLAIANVPRQHEDFWDNDDFLTYFAAHKKRLEFDFLTDLKFEYNNTNFFLLASIVKHVSGKSFSQFVHEEIFKPAGMDHSFVYESLESVPAIISGHNRALGYQWNKKNNVWFESWGAPPDRHEKMLVVGDGNIWSNLEDMARWDQVVREQKLLKPETWKQALAPHKTRDGKINHYGLGWGLYFDDPSKLYGYGHDGSWGGFETSYYRYLTENRSTVILSNRGTLDTNKLWDALGQAIEKHHSKP